MLRCGDCVIIMSHEQLQMFLCAKMFPVLNETTSCIVNSSYLLKTCDKVSAYVESLVDGYIK